MFNEKFLVLLVIALIVIGPQRLPEYAENLGRWVRQLRDMAWDARDAMRAELGPEFDEVDWSMYDPRRYDPRRIVRDALLEPPQRGGGGSTAIAAVHQDTGRDDEDGPSSAVDDATGSAALEPRDPDAHDQADEDGAEHPHVEAVFDPDAT